VTTSEALFEHYCTRLDYNCAKIPTGSDRSSDYLVRGPGWEVIVEIKELSANDDDRRVFRDLRQGKLVISGDRPGRRVNEHIRDAASQLAKFRNTGRACLVLFYDNILVDGERPAIPSQHLSSSGIDFGLYGLQTAIFAMDPQSKLLRYISDGRGGRRQATASTRQYISAVAVLNEGETPYEPWLEVYHNYFATVRLSRKTFSSVRDRHFRKPDHPDRTPQEWEGF
jgi:hypothetical protein